MAGRRFIPYPAWSPTSPLVNPSLELPLSPPAFDWHVPSVEGVDSLRGVPPSGIKFAFSGHQPESAELLYQALFLLGGRAWTLSFEYQTRGIAPAQSGLFWNLSAAGDSPPLHPSEEWSSFSVSWTMPPQDSLRRLALIFRRPPGQVRTDGELYIRGLRLEAARR
ncbi:MAG: hypothetical protein HZB13_07510 [Acidobacteria bacterium]|nr:hypothetical protein [Acidobacteriota bacterium]